MKSLILYRKVIVFALGTVLLAFGIQGIGYSQLAQKMDEQTSYVTWIVTTDGSGSGVLIEKDLKHVVTNAHVVDNDKEVLVYFAVRDSSGNIIRARPFYKNKEHRRTLNRLGFVTRGRVIAKNDPETAPDLALIELDGLPETAKEFSFNDFISLSSDHSKIAYPKMTEENPIVYIFGHPANRPLWQGKAGEFIRYDRKNVLISADAYHGNSGGPVLHNDKLIGITKSVIKEKSITFAVPTSAIFDLYKTLKPVKIFSIYNNTEVPMSYKVQWEKDGELKERSIKPKEEQLHSHLFEELSEEYPKILFKNSQNSKESTEIEYSLKTKFRYLGTGIEKVENHIDINDALRHQFEFDSETKEISLKELKLLLAFSIRNKTKEGLSFQYTWNEDHEWEEVDLKPNPNIIWSTGSEKASPGYPLIRFNENPEIRRPPEGSEGEPLETYIGYFGKDTENEDNLNDLSQLPPILYQLDLNPETQNPETQKVFLDKLERTQKFSIQNTSKSDILFEYKWQEDDKWEIDYILSNRTKSYSRPLLEKVSEDYPKIRFSGSGDLTLPDGSDRDEESLKTQIGYFGKDGKIEESFIHIDDLVYRKNREYHFKLNPETEKFSFHEGLLVKKSTSQSFFNRLLASTLFAVVVLIIEVVIGAALVINFYFPKRHIFSIQNDTESTVNYHTKWTKKDDWEEHSLESNEFYNQWWTGFFKKRPQIRFGQIINGEKETKEFSLETKARRFGRNASSKIARKHAYKYHFDFDPETNVLVLYDSEKK